MQMAGEAGDSLRPCLRQLSGVENIQLFQAAIWHSDIDRIAALLWENRAFAKVARVAVEVSCPGYAYGAPLDNTPLYVVYHQMAHHYI